MDWRTAMGLPRRRWRRGLEAAAEREVEIDALRELFGSHAQQRDTRVGGCHALLLERALVGAADPQRGLRERERAALFVVGAAQAADPRVQRVTGRNGALDVVQGAQCRSGIG